MNANEITFGIEIETTMPAGACEVGHYHVGTQVTWLPEGWKAQRDGSIEAGMGRVAVEFVSPVLKGADGLSQVITAIQAIAAHGGKVNSSCGFHVHVGWVCDKNETLKRLISLVANFETAIFATTGTVERAISRWCGSIQRHQNVNQAAAASGSDRYHVLNLTNLRNPSRPDTVEFRAFAGTLNVVKAVGYIRLCVGLVERAMTTKRTVSFVAKKPKTSSPIHRSGVGHTALARLFYQLGWTKGRTKVVCGNIESDISLKDVKTELVRLAKKFDTRFNELPNAVQRMYEGV